MHELSTNENGKKNDYVDVDV